MGKAYQCESCGGLFAGEAASGHLAYIKWGHLNCSRDFTVSLDLHGVIPDWCPDCQQEEIAQALGLVIPTPVITGTETG